MSSWIIRNPGWCLAILVITIFSQLWITSSLEASTNQQIIQLQISNPYRWDVIIEVKCDWDNDQQNYRYLNKLKVIGKKITQVKLPSYLRKCELWPHINL